VLGAGSPLDWALGSAGGSAGSVAGGALIVAAGGALTVAGGAPAVVRCGVSSDAAARLRSLPPVERQQQSTQQVTQIQRR
jgi:hypothetical protein